MTAQKVGLIGWHLSLQLSYSFWLRLRPSVACFLQNGNVEIIPKEFGHSNFVSIVFHLTCTFLPVVLLCIDSCISDDVLKQDSGILLLYFTTWILIQVIGFNEHDFLSHMRESEKMKQFFPIVFSISFYTNDITFQLLHSVRYVPSYARQLAALANYDQNNRWRGRTFSLAVFISCCKCVQYKTCFYTSEKIITKMRVIKCEQYGWMFM